MNSATTPCTLPDTLPISVARIQLGGDQPWVGDIDSLASYYTSILKIITMLPEQDKLHPTYDDDCENSFFVLTDNSDVLKIAHQLRIIDEFSTVIETIWNHYCDDVCSECLDELIDHVLQHHDFDIEVNGDGELELKLGPCKAATKGKKVFDSLSSMPAELTAV